MDIGVLFDRDEELAHICTKLLRQEGFFVEENQPYSGKNGLIYSAHRHGTEKQIIKGKLQEVIQECKDHVEETFWW